MDPEKYAELRHQVIQNMTQNQKHRSKKHRRGHNRKYSCPTVLIPSHFVKALQNLDIDNVKEIEEVVNSNSPDISVSENNENENKPPITVKKTIMNEIESCLGAIIID